MEEGIGDWSAHVKADLEATFGPGPYTVMIAGVFDILHPGHIFYIQQAAQFGDVIVILARNTSVMRVKHHDPSVDEAVRLMMVNSIKGVAQAVLGDPSGKWYLPVLAHNPHLFLMGFNQPGDPAEFQDKVHQLGGRTIFRRVPESHDTLLFSSSQLKRHIVETYSEASPRTTSRSGLL